MPAGWSNPKVQYDFTWGEYKDKEKNYPELTWKEYRDMKGYPDMPKDITDDEIGNSAHIEGNKKYSFKEAYERDNAVDPEHYHFAIEPWKFIAENNLDFAQGNVIKYICRYKFKNGIEDLKKAKQYIDMLIDKEQNGNN